MFPAAISNGSAIICYANYVSVKKHSEIWVSNVKTSGMIMATRDRCDISVTLTGRDLM